MRISVKRGALVGAVWVGSAFATQAAACGSGSAITGAFVPVAGAVESAPAEPWEALLARELEEGQLRDSRSRLEAVLKAEPQNVSARLALGAVLVHEGRREDAIAVLEAGIDCDPSQLALARALARLYLHEGDGAAAMDVMRRYRSQLRVESLRSAR